MAATEELSNMTSLVWLMMVWFSKAKSAMKIDIVKPIPANIPTARMSFHAKSDGSLQIPDWVAKKVKANIPKGLPTNSPKATPKL